MDWTYTNLIIETVAGVIGGFIGGNISREYTFGQAGHFLTGLAGGALGGYFFQAAAVTMVTGTGSLMPVSSSNNIALQSLTGLVSGACLTMIVGFVKHAISEHRANKP